jgi:hypothetical protein
MNKEILRGNNGGGSAGPAIGDRLKPGPDSARKSALAGIVMKAMREYNVKKSVLPDSRKIEESLLETAGIEPTEGHAFVMVGVDSDDIRNFTSACGHDGETLFSKPAVLGFLMSQGVKEVIGLIYGHTSPDTYGNCNIPLSAIVLPIDSERGWLFEQIVSENGGSFRCERLKLGTTECSIFESE